MPTSVAMTEPNLHPSGLTWDRYNFPFKTQEELLQIRIWLEQKKTYEFDSSIPF